MKPSRTIAITAISALAGLGALAGPIGLGPTAAANSDVMRLQATEDLGLTVIPCEQCTLNPFGFNRGDHIGEFLVNHGTLADNTGQIVGHYATHELGTTVAAGGPPEVQITGTLSLPNGQITVQGLEEPPTDHGTIAITGGTGRYLAAKGELRFRDTSETTAEMTLVLR